MRAGGANFCVRPEHLSAPSTHNIVLAKCVCGVYVAPGMISGRMFTGQVLANWVIGGVRWLLQRLGPRRDGGGAADIAARAQPEAGERPCQWQQRRHRGKRQQRRRLHPVAGGDPLSALARQGWLDQDQHREHQHVHRLAGDRLGRRDAPAIRCLFDQRHELPRHHWQRRPPFGVAPPRRQGRRQNLHES